MCEETWKPKRRTPRCRYCGSPSHPMKKPGCWGRLLICSHCRNVLWPDGTRKCTIEGRYVRPAEWVLDEYSEWQNSNGWEDSGYGRS